MTVHSAEVLCRKLVRSSDDNRQQVAQGVGYEFGKSRPLAHLPVNGGPPKPGRAHFPVLWLNSARWRQ